MIEVSPMRAPRSDSVDGPHAKRGRLRNGNTPGHPSTAPRCGARTRRGAPCQAPAMANGRCRMHGGLSTGPKTPEGLERCRKARWKHGRYSAEAKRRRRRSNARRRWTKEFLSVLESYESMRGLLLEIEDQMARGDTRGLKGKCAQALRMWDRYEAVLAASEGLHGYRTSKPRRHLCAGHIQAMLEDWYSSLRQGRASSPTALRPPTSPADRWPP